MNEVFPSPKFQAEETPLVTMPVKSTQSGEQPDVVSAEKETRGNGLTVTIRSIVLTQPFVSVPVIV